MITLFATPRDFSGIYKTIQENAFSSWRSLSPEIQIIIFGDSVGAKENAIKINAEYVVNIKCSDKGVPLLSDLFIQADKLAKYPIMTFINADIILPNNFLESIVILSSSLDKYLMVGHRWDMDVEEKIKFDDLNHQKGFWNNAKDKSIKHNCTAIDYFIYKRNQWKNIPDFIIGRLGYDNWLIWNARRRFIPVVDASDFLMVIHQNHESIYHTIKHNPKQYNDKEANHNFNLINGKTLNLLDCNYNFNNKKIVRKTNRDYKIRNLHQLPRIFPEFSFLIKIYRRLYKLISTSNKI